MAESGIAELLLDGRIESVPEDVDAAGSLLAEAERHLDSSARIAAHDPNGAYQLLYDAVRKGVSALMLARGHRARPRFGAHRVVVVYAEEALREGRAAADVLHLDRMRRSRNRSEYEARLFGAAEIAADLGHARVILGEIASRIEANA